MIGRGGGIFLAKILTPTIYAAIDLVVCVIALALLAIPQIMGAPLLYTATAIFGLAMSSVYANGLNFVAKRINCSGRDKSFPLMRPGGIPTYPKPKYIPLFQSGRYIEIPVVLYHPQL